MPLYANDTTFYHNISLGPMYQIHCMLLLSKEKQTYDEELFV